MDGKDKSVGASSHELLFVLRYQRRKVLFRILYTSFFILLMLALLLILLVCFLAGLRTASEVWFVFMVLGWGLFLLLLACSVINLMLFDEIRLYEDRIVKVSHLTGGKEIKLANAQFWIDGRDTDFRRGPVNVIIISNLGTNALLTRIKGIVCDERLADWKDVKRLRGWLAYLSGRTIEEFEQGTLIAEKLIRDDVAKRPPVIDKFRIEEDALRYDPGPKDYKNIAGTAFDRAPPRLIGILILAIIGMAVILYLSIREMLQ